MRFQFYVSISILKFLDRCIFHLSLSLANELISAYSPLPLIYRCWLLISFFRIFPCLLQSIELHHRGGPITQIHGCRPELPDNQVQSAPRVLRLLYAPEDLIRPLYSLKSSHLYTETTIILFGIFRCSLLSPDSTP